MGEGFQRKHKEDRPVVAICYDFDKTLSPDDMQAQGFIQKVGYNVGEFWEESNRLARENGMDSNLAWMYLMITKAVGKTPMTKESLREYGSKVRLFPGVRHWFRRIREFGIKNNVIVEHYIISSGLREMIEGTPVGGEFEKIYASSFYFDDAGIARWPAQAINYTGKTQFLFRIEKGVLDVNDPGVNDSFPPEKIRVPFRNIIYIGDSDTDIPCMKLVSTNGGHSIGVYDAETEDKTKVWKMMREKRIRYFAPADYNDGSDLDSLVKDIILRTAMNERLEERHINDLAEIRGSAPEAGSRARRLLRQNIIAALERSNSFTSTRTVISDAAGIRDWTQEEIEEILEIGLMNSQVRCILGEESVRDFYQGLLELPGCGMNTESAGEIEHLIRTGAKRA